MQIDVFCKENKQQYNYQTQFGRTFAPVFKHFEPINRRKLYLLF